MDEILEIAQDDDDDLLLDDGDVIVVTGSRLRRSEFTSASPLKVLSVEESIQAGIVDVASIVQRTSVASGTQFDNTFTGFVTDSGPGSATINLRGLDAERSLILLNGRRLAPAGVQGAPTRPDLNLIPLNMLERVDLLTEGASAIYGADAVAGVVNFITRTDFDGVEVDLFSSATEHGGGSEFRASVATGITNDRGSFGIGAEFYSRDRIKRGQRDFTPCVRDVEVNPTTGEIREVCINGNFSNMFLDPTTALFGADVVGDGRGTSFGIIGFDFDNGSGFRVIPTDGQPGSPGLFIDPVTGLPVANSGLGSDWLFDPRYNANDTSDDLDLFQGQERYSLFANMAYDLEAFGNAELYAEALYGNRRQNIFSGAPQAFPSVTCDNPYVQADPVLSSASACSAPFNDILAGAGGLNQLVVLPRIAEAFGPIDLDVSLTRGMMGIRGDLESIIPTGKLQSGGENFGFNVGNWTYDAFASYDRNQGITRQSALNEERLQLSLQTAVRNTDGSVSCGLDVPPDLFGFISAGPCVPLDVTDPVLYLENRLPTAAAAYLAGTETTVTTLEQSVLGGSITGDLAYVPAGTVPFLIGVEYRRDSIISENSFLVTADAGTGRSEVSFTGATEFLEAFMETEIPILKGAPLAEELTFTGAARWTEEQNFGALWTYRVQGIYRPTDWITTSASFGTTYRAPNLREQFLPGQTQFLPAFGPDPCVNSTFNGLDPDLQAVVRNNCTLQGADVDSLGIGGATTIPFTVSGNQNVNAETSESLYLKAVVEQPWFEDFDFSVALGYFELTIEDSVEEPNGAQIIAGCLADEEFPNLTSPFCDLIERNTSPDPARNFISDVNGQFRNLGQIRTDGFDFDVRYSQDFAMGNNELTLTSSLSGTYLMSDRAATFPGDPLLGRDGRPNRPHLRGDLFTQLEYGDFALNHTMRYIGETKDDDIDAVRTALADGEFTRNAAGDIVVTNDVRLIGTDFRTGNVVFASGFRDVEETEDQLLHDISIGYTADTWNALFGVRNVFDQEPPIVDDGEGYFTSANAVLGGGYDIRGRSFFARIAKTF